MISTNYKFLSDLPYRAGWFYEVHDEDGVNDYYNFIESLDLGEVLTEKLAEDWGEKFGDELLVLYDDSLEEYEGCNKEFEWEGIQESFKHEFRFFNTKPLYTTNFIGPLSYQAFSFLKLLALS